MVEKLMLRSRPKLNTDDEQCKKTMPPLAEDDLVANRKRYPSKNGDDRSKQSSSTGRSTTNATKASRRALARNLVCVTDSAAFWACYNNNTTLTPLPTLQGQHGDSDDDYSSTDGSSNYFSRQDFSASNWKDAASYLPPWGFAVFLGSLVITHPFLFAAGALTAVGTSKAFRPEAALCGSGSLFFPLSMDDEEDIKDTILETDKELVRDVSSVTIEDTDAQQQQEEGESLANDKLPLHERNPANLATPELASAWVQCHYPSLKFCAEENVDFAGLNALEFFHVFFATDAPYNFQELQKKRKDKDIVYGDWRSLGQAKQLSLHPKAQQLDQLNTTPYINERLITFKTKTGSYFGPPYADATKVQRALLASKKLLIIEARTTMKDVPYSDRFYIMERWVVTATKKDDMYHASLSIHSQVFFTKSCPFESQIVSKSQETFKEISSTWINMAHQALKLTEKARQIRLQQSSSRDPIQEIPKSESVEVQHTGSGSSVIVGENEKEQVRPESPKKKSSFRKSFSKMVKKRRNSLSSTLTGSASS